MNATDSAADRARTLPGTPPGACARVVAALGRVVAGLVGGCRGTLVRSASAAVALAAASCGGADGDSRALLELERMEFVAPGQAGGLVALRLLEEVAAEEPLLVDRFEVTRADWEHWFGAPPERGALTLDEYRTTELRGDWPAFCSYFEAQELAGLRGMRLPTPGEWLYLGIGRQARYPWGQRLVKSIANTTELGLGRPVPVGCFEGGKAGSGVHDLIGNVAEWVEGPLPGEAWQGPWDPGGLGHQAWAMGGSYQTRIAELYGSTSGEAGGWNARSWPAGQRQADLGVRCVAPAGAWLGERLDELAAAPESPTRLERVGERFGPEALPVLELLRSERGSHPALAALMQGARR